MSPEEPGILDRFIPLTALGAVCVVYLRTMPPGLVGVGRGLWDSQETQAVGVTWGYLHPPGYPLQSLLANLLAHSVGLLPGVEPGWGVTLLSVLAMVLATGFVYLVVRQLTGNDAASLLAMLVFAFSPGPWRTAITPEVYALNVALWALAFWLALRAAQSTPGRADFWLGLALGLAVGHHRTAALLVPAVVLYLGMRRGWSLAWGRLLLGLFLSLAVYIYLPLAHTWRSPMTPGDATSLPGFWELVSARAWSVFFHLPAGSSEWAARLESVFDALAAQLGIAGSGLGLIGLGWLVSHRPGDAARLALFGLPPVGLLAFALVYQVPDVATMLGPLVMILCLGIGGLGAWVWSSVIGRRSSVVGLRSLATVLAAAAVGAWLLVGNYAQVDESWDQRGQAVLAELACELSGSPGEVWLTAESGYAGSLVAYIAERVGRPLVWASPWREWDYLAALGEGRRVFLLKDMPGGWQYPEALKGLAGPYRYLAPTGSQDVLELVVESSRSSPEGQGEAAPSPANQQDYVALDQPFGSAIVLRGYTLRACRYGGTSTLRLALYWEAQTKPEQDWRVKAHLLGSDGQLVAQADSEHPVRGSRPITGWEPGQVVRDVHDFPLMPGADLRTAQIVVGLYQIAGDEFPSLGDVRIEIGRLVDW